MTGAIPKLLICRNEIGIKKNEIKLNKNKNMYYGVLVRTILLAPQRDVRSQLVGLGCRQKVSGEESGGRKSTVPETLI